MGTNSLEELKSAIRNLTVGDRRKIALFILELERDHVQQTVGPQLARDIDDVSRAAQEALEKLKKILNKQT